MAGRPRRGAAGDRRAGPDPRAQRRRLHGGDRGRRAVRGRAARRSPSTASGSSWDPPDPGGATIGGIVATADSGPLRHRYGGVRDLVVGITIVLSDGTVAKAGGKVIKNVAGYDLAKLFAGSMGTLGLIASVSVRLHPLPDTTATVQVEQRRPGRRCWPRRSKLRQAPARGRLLRRRLAGRPGPAAAAVLAAPRRSSRPSRAGDVADIDWGDVARAASAARSC